MQSLGVKGWREEGENGIGKSSRQRGREHGDSVITLTLPDTAVRLMLDSYPQSFSALSVSHTVYLLLLKEET